MSTKLVFQSGYGRDTFKAFKLGDAKPGDVLNDGDSIETNDPDYYLEHWPKHFSDPNAPKDTSKTVSAPVKPKDEKPKDEKPRGK